MIIKRRTALALAFIMLFSLCAFAAADSYKTLKEGDAGDTVLALKNRMRELGYFNPGSKMSNVYNETMIERVKWLEQQNGLTPSGVASAKLQELIYSDTVRKANEAPIITAETAELFSASGLPSDYPETLDAEGYMTDMSAGPYLYSSREQGLWIYLTDTLQIRITQYIDELTPLIWYESDIKMRGDEEIRTLMDVNASAKKVALKDPRLIAKEYGAVFAVSDDFYGYRKRNGHSSLGVIIRAGKILAESTRRSGSVGVPNLELIALFEDGSMRTFQSKEHTAQEYIEMGVTDTWAFGPILIRDGEINPELLEGDKYQNQEPRSAMGMVSPGHYLFLAVTGRSDESDGVAPCWLAQRMQALGCTEALNLDGGNSVALIFMDDMLNKPEDTTNKNYMKGVRALSSLIGVGVKPEGLTAE